MAISVTYDGLSPWGSTSPYVSLSFEPQSLGVLGTVNVRTVTLNGGVAEADIGNLEAAKNSIISTFSNNQKDFEFTDSSGNNVTYENVFVDSVSFPDQNYIGRLNYSVTLRVYDFDSYAVLEPKDEVSVETSSSKVTTISHTVSALGIDNAASFGIDSAKAFVQARVAIVPVTVTSFASNMNYIVQDEVENYNRLSGAYSITVKYLFDALSSSGGSEQKTYTRYNVNTSSSLESDFQNVSIEAVYTGGVNTTSAELLADTDFESDLHGIAQGASGLTLHSVPESLSIDEDINSKTVTVKAEFNDNPCFGSEDWWFDHSISVNTDYTTGVTKIDVSGELKVKGDLTQRNSVIDAFVTSTNVETFLYGYASTSYGQVDGGLGYTLSGYPSSIAITKNPWKGTLSINGSFSDEDSIAGYAAVNWDVNVTTSVPYAKTAPSATRNGHWSIQYFQFETREKIKASVDVTSREDPFVGDAAMRAQATNLENDIYAMAAGAYYTVNSSESSKEENTSSVSLSSERSYAGSAPLISLGVGPAPF